ncbi:MAG: GtrA family protein [Tannerella sp.]|jgi:putative flippase GtrA|nr:GtrA family protein [Tannerella sp.]
MRRLIGDLLVKDTDSAPVQLLRYALVGGVAAAVNFACLFALTDLCGMYYLVSNVLSFLAGLTVNYALCKRFVFRGGIGNGKVEFMIYGLVGVVGLLFDTGLMYFFTDALHLHYLLSKVISTAAVLLWNFTARKFMYIITDRRRRHNIH